MLDHTITPLNLLMYNGGIENEMPCIYEKQIESLM